MNPLSCISCFRRRRLVEIAAVLEPALHQAQAERCPPSTSSPVAFMNSLVVAIDEEQRFGVAAKEKLKKIKAGVDVLTMSATPIPRTLHMSPGGLRDLSVIESRPADAWRFRLPSRLSTRPSFNRQ